MPLEREKRPEWHENDEGEVNHSDRIGCNGIQHEGDVS